ncbi:unnamed protein product [Ectocarpus fasciculatus]
MSRRTQSTTTHPEPAVREDLPALCEQAEGFLKRYSTAVRHDAQRRAAEIRQPITEEDLKDGVVAMTDTLKDWIQAPSSGGLAQFVLPWLFRACLEEVEESHKFIRSILFPPGASTTNTTTTAMRDHIVEHHEKLFHLTPGEELGKAIDRILSRVGDYLVTRRSFSEHEVTKVVWKSDLGKVAVAYLRIVVRARIHDPVVRLEGDNNARRATEAAGSTSNSQTAPGVDVVQFTPELHSDPVRGDTDTILLKRCTVIFPAILGGNGKRLTKSYTVRYSAVEEKKHPELGTSSAPAATVGDHQGDHHATTRVNDLVSIEGAEAQSRNSTRRANDDSS